jgi:hypothetical protein
VFRVFRGSRNRILNHEKPRIHKKWLNIKRLWFDNSASSMQAGSPYKAVTPNPKGRLKPSLPNQGRLKPGHPNQNRLMAERPNQNRLKPSLPNQGRLKPGYPNQNRLMAERPNQIGLPFISFVAA